MQIDLQFFGGRGASAKTVSYYTNKAKQYMSKSKSYEQQARQMYKKYGSDMTNEQRREWQSLGAKSRDFEQKSYDMQSKAEALKNEKKKKTFVNSFGEATRRTITTQSYERQRKRRTKSVLRNMGY